MINVLDCTLRDGSYAIDYQFTAEDTSRICAALEKAGVRYIEIGHGVGLNGSPKHGEAAASDEEYLQAASQALTGAKFGMFCIPGIARLEDIDMAASHGMHFLRVGTNITETESAKAFIEKGRALGMHVSYNMMKSYALPAAEVADRARMAREYGAEVIFVVDSAGGMVPDDVHEYVARVKDAVRGADVGFHGHNNLGLAMANSLAAIKAGATWIDATLQGMGRSIGNTQTEALVALLERMGYTTGIDLLGVMGAGDTLIRPIMREKTGVDSLSVVIGLAKFHSSFLPIVQKVAKERNLDIRLLILQVSKRDLVLVTEEIANEAADDLLKL